MSFDDERRALKTIETVENIWDHPVVQCLISAVGEICSISPLVDLVNNGVSKMLEKQMKRKQEQLLQELLDSRALTEENIKNVDFVIEFAKLLSAVNRTRDNTKIQCMVKIFKGTVCYDKKDYDLYEEYLQRVYDMSEREMNILFIMHECEKKEELTNYSGDSREQKIERIWHEEKQFAKEKLGIDEATLRSIIIGMQRTGFCTVEYIHYAAGDIQMYLLTQYFKDFMKYISI